MVLSLEERVDPKRAGLLVIDVQNAFAHENGSTVRAYQKIGIDVRHIRNMVPRLRNFIDQTRSYGVPVIFIRTTFNKWNSSRTWKESHEVRFGEFDESHLLEGSWDSDFYGVAPQAEDCLVTKHRISAFFGTDLDLILRSKGIDSLVLTGCITGGCVEATALDAWMRDYYVTFVEDCCGAYTPEDHQATLDRWKQRTMISSSDAIAKAWQQQPRFFPASPPSSSPSSPRT